MKESPYSSFGTHLKAIREAAQESLDEVCGAVEIDPATLSSVESGSTQPSEDLVLLLINHFELADDEAEKMWDLAGYKETSKQASVMAPEQHVQQTAYITPADARIVYTDLVHVNANKFGVVINFMQNLGPNQPMAVSRVGMSHEHAEAMLEVLQKTVQLHREAAKAHKKPKKES